MALDPSSAFAFPDYRRLLLARVATMVALQVQGVAVAWHVVSRTGRALDLGWVGLAQFLPAAWKVKLKDILLLDEEGKLLNVNLDIKNPKRKNEFEYREPAELVSSIIEKEKQVMRLMKEIENTINVTISNEA